jgi:hypothetical protein
MLNRRPAQPMDRGSRACDLAEGGPARRAWIQGVRARASRHDDLSHHAPLRAHLSIKRNRARAIAIAMMLGTAGCNVFASEPDRVEQARVIIDGTTPVPLTLVTSGNFIVQNDSSTFEPVVTLFLADTASLQLPYESMYSMGEYERFLVRLINPDTATATVRMRVLVDGRLEYDQSATMSDASMQFVFRVARYR